MHLVKVEHLKWKVESCSPCFFGELVKITFFAIVRKCKSKTSVVTDDIMAFMKITIAHIIKPLALICHFFQKTGFFSEKLKFPKAVPYFKNGDTLKLNNYGPMSLLSGFSMIFER